MSRVGAERWFHTLVVVGAALGGCAGKTDAGPSAIGGSSGNGGSSGGVAPTLTGGVASGGALNTTGGVSPSPRDCAFDAQFVCDDYATRSGCRCDPAAPKDRSDCPSQFDFVCTALPCADSHGELCVAGSVWVDCRCDPSRARPMDCANPQQFYCATTLPYWGDCSCRSDLALNPAECRDSYCCQSDDPSFGCGCFCAGIK